MTNVKHVESLESLRGDFQKAHVDYLKEILARQELEKAKLELKVDKKEIDLNHPALLPTLDELENIWAAKFGMSWVSKAEIEDSNDAEFWSIVCKRLCKANRLEDLDLMHSYQTVFRLCK
jgi:hypothetical protein